MSSESVLPTWGFNVFYVMSIISIPVYLVVFLCLIRLRSVSKIYNSTFYSILLQHCIADLFSILGYIALSPARNIYFIRKFYYDYQEYYIAAATYNIIYVSLYIRCTGILFLSLHRYIAITSPHNALTQKVQSAAKWKIVLVYWLTPTVLSIVVLKDTDFHFDGLENMSIITNKEIIQRNTVMALVVVSITCVVSSLVYISLFLYVRKNSVKLSKTLRREVLLAFQVLILLIAFFAILAFYAVLNYFSQTHSTGPVFYMRGIYPMVNGFLSYINPFCILLLNKEFTRQFIKSMTCKGYKESEVQVSGIASNSTKHQKMFSNQNQRGSGRAAIN